MQCHHSEYFAYIMRACIQLRKEVRTSKKEKERKACQLSYPGYRISLGRRHGSQFGPSSSERPHVLGSGQVFTSGGKFACFGVSHLDQDHLREEEKVRKETHVMSI